MNSSNSWITILGMICSLCVTHWGVVQTVADKSTPNALWWVVSSCVQNEKGKHPLKLCEKVDLQRGYAVLKDRRGKTQFLLIPTDRIAGVESPEILRSGAHNYWQDAWNERGYVSARAKEKLPDRDIGLAINSAFARTQNQLHIHIDCLRPEVIAKLRASKDAPAGQWFNVHFARPLHNYHALAVDSLKTNPFKIVSAIAPDMSRETIVAARVGKRFILLADTAHISKGDFASGEELLDHDCKVAEKRK